MTDSYVAPASVPKNRLKFSEDVLRYPGGEAGGGFNSRIMGYSRTESLSGIPHGPRWGAYSSGWELADKMVRDGKLYAVHNFHHSHECSGRAFPYGGKFVCETCTWPGSASLEKPWWSIRCYPDGNAWCCVGLEFEDLQASDCYAFGDTYEAAIKAYGDLMTANREGSGRNLADANSNHSGKTP